MLTKSKGEKAILNLWHLLVSALIVVVMTMAQPASAQETNPDTTRLSPLIEILKDDAARAELIDQLERAATESGAAVTEAAPPPEQEVISFGRRIALVTQEIAEGIAERIAGMLNGFKRAGNIMQGLQGDALSVLWDAFIELLLVIVLTVAIFLALRKLLIPFYRRMGTRAGESGLVRTVLLFLGTAVIDAAVVIAAWAIGYGVTVLAVGEYGQIGIRQSLYLNAFLIVELSKVVIRAVLSPSSGGLRVLPLDDRPARRFNRYLNVVVSVLGYGQLLIVPLVSKNASYVAGQAVSALLSVFVLLYLVYLVVRHRKGVSEWLMDRLSSADARGEQIEASILEDDGTAVAEAHTQPHGFLARVAKHWHLFTLAYLAVMFGIVMTQRTSVVMDSIVSSGKIIVVLILASIISRYLSHTMEKGLHFPEGVNQRLPLLEIRLNKFVPKLLLIARYVIVASVVLFAFDTFGLIRVRGWLESQIGLQLTGTLFTVVLILLFGYLVWLAMTSWVDYRLNPDYGNVPTARETTLLTLLRNAATIAIILLTLMFSLSEIGLDIGPLLASAGVLGLAIGFGAQKMVQDIITGVFIQFENAINVGDVITVGGTTGTVEKLTVRSVSLRDVHGAFHIIPFSSVDMVSNYTRDFSFFVCDMGVAYREDLEEAKQAMFDAFEDLKKDADQKPFILGDLEWFGLNAFGDSALVLRARIKTVPGKQWGVGRAYNGILKRIFDERGIEIPFPHQTIFFGESKDGKTQPIKIENIASDTE